MLEDNVVFLKKNYPELYEKINNVKILNDNFIIEQTRNNQETIKVKKEEVYVYLHSKYDPLREAEAVIKKFEEKETIDENSHVIFYGLGLGYHVELFTRKHPNTLFSLYEPSAEVFQHFLDKINLKKLPVENLKNIQCEFEPEAMDFFLAKLLNKTNKKLIIMDLPTYGNVFAERYNKFFSKFNELIKSTRNNMHTNYAFQKRWIINSMKNLKEVLSTPNIVTEKQGCFKNKTAILVAAGPSLNDEIENLRYIKDNGLAYIFSVGSAINTLVYNNIYPHAACTIDPSIKNQEVLKIIKEKNIIEIPVIFGSSVGYETLENYPGNKYHMITTQDSIASYYLRDDRGDVIDRVYDAPTVAAATLQLLYILGFERIILVGQNLGYRDKKRYSEGIVYSRIDVTDSELGNALWVEDVYDNQILTTNGFNIMRRQIEMYIKQIPGINVLNATKGGAKIEGTEFIELKEIIAGSLKERIVNESELLKLEKNKTTYNKEYIAAQLKKMEKSYDSALKINKEYKIILNKIEKAINGRKYSQAQGLYVKLDDQLKKIENNDFYKTFILPMNRVQYKILADSIESLNEEKNSREQGKRVLEGFGNFIDRCIDDIDMIESTFCEMNENINIYISI